MSRFWSRCWPSCPRAPRPRAAVPGTGSRSRRGSARPTPTSRANRARNDIQESLEDLGPDTTYSAGQPIDPAKEAADQPNCTPLSDWRFTLGQGYRSRAVSGPWGSLSIVTNPYVTDIVTLPQTPLLDPAGSPTGQSIAGAVTIELTQAQLDRAVQANSLWIQGGTTSDPILNLVYPGQYGFGALRCAIDNLNGDNVEWISYPAGANHVFCLRVLRRAAAHQRQDPHSQDGSKGAQARSSTSTATSASTPMAASTSP